MIKLEHLKPVDIIVILGLSFLWALAIYLINFSLPYLFELVFFFSAVFATLTALLVKKIGSVTIFFAVAGMMTIPISFLGLSSLDKILSLTVAGILFEVTVFALGRSVSLIIASVTSNAALSWLINWLGDAATLLSSSAVLNFAIISSLTGAAGSLVGLVLWRKLKVTKIVLRYELNGSKARRAYKPH